MAIAIASTSTNTANATSVTITKPTGVTDGDLMVAQIVAGSSSVTVDTLSGWTKIQDGHPASAGPFMASFYKVASSEGSDYTFSITGGSTLLVGGIVRITGAKVIDTSSEQYNDSATTTATGATVTPTYADGYLLFLVGANGGNVSAYAIATDNPSWTESWDVNESTLYGAMAYASRPQTTATGAATATITSSRSAVHIIVIKENPTLSTVLDTVTATDSKTLNMTSKILETLTLTDTITSVISRLWTKLTRNVKTWTNQNKD